MLVDRTRFLKLAIAIAATTVTTVACSSGDAGDEEDATGAAISTEAGGACGADSIKKPGEGSMTPSSYAEGFCFNLAVSDLRTPDAEGIESGFFDFVWQHCHAYSTQLQPAVAKKVQACLVKADKARRVKKADGTELVNEFDSMAMYNCGKDTLSSICKDGIDGRTNSNKDANGKGRADRMTDALVKGGDARPRATILSETMAVLSGLKSGARVQMDRCVTKDFPNLHSCLEGLQADFSFAEDASEPKPTGADACVGPAANPALAASACAPVMAKILKEEAEGAFAVPEFAEGKCNDYVTKLEPAAAKAAIDCLLATKKGDTYQNIYTCGAVGLRRVCQDASLDAECKGIVDSVKTSDPNANTGGRLTRECRALLPGLKPAARREVASCVKQRAPSFATGGFANEALWSCVEGL